MRGDATTSTETPADGQTTATASTKPSDVPVKNNGALCSPPPPKVSKMSALVNGMSDPPISNGVVENGVFDAPPAPSISPPPVASEDEDAFLAEEVAKPAEKSFSNSSSSGDLSLRLTDDDDEEAEEGVGDSVESDKLDSSDDGVVAKVVSEEGSAGAPSAAGHDDLVCSPKDDPEHSSKPFTTEVDLKSFRDVDDTSSNDNLKLGELSPNADNESVENSSDKGDPKENMDIVAIEAVSDESDGALVGGDVICKPTKEVLEGGEETDSMLLDNVEVGVKELPVVLVGRSEEPVLELVSDEAVGIGNEDDEMEVDEGSPKLSIQVENEIMPAQDDSGNGIAVANITDNAILSSGRIDDDPEDVCMKEEQDCARDDADAGNIALKDEKEEKMEISSAIVDGNENGDADVDVETDIDVKAYVDIKNEDSEMDGGSGEKEEIALVKGEPDSPGTAYVDAENKVSESLSENSRPTVLVPKNKDYVGLVPKNEDCTELLPQEAEVLDTAALKEADTKEPEKLCAESDTGEKLIQKSEIKLCQDGSADDWNDEGPVDPTLDSEVVDKKDLGDSMSTIKLPEVNHAEEALNSTKQSKEMQETDLKKVVITAEPSEAKQEEILNDVEHTEAKHEEIVNDVEHTEEAKTEEILNDVEHAEAKTEEILKHAEAKMEKADSDAEDTEIKQDQDLNDVEDSEVKQVANLDDVVHSEEKQETVDANPPEFMETDNLVDKIQNIDNSSKMDTAESVENKCPELKVENVDVPESKATADNVKEEKTTLKAELSVDESDNTLPMKTDESNDLHAPAHPNKESEPPKCAESFTERIKRLMLDSLDDSDSSRDVSDIESQPEGEVVVKLENAIDGDDAPGTDTNEGSVGNGLKLKRESDGEDVPSSPSASKRPRRSPDADEPDVKNADPGKENVDSGNGKSAVKRSSERPVLRGDVKKVRRVSGENEADAADVKPAVGVKPAAGGGKTTSQAHKPMTNLDKAIARVATGGLNKRDRETCELLKLLDSKSIEHITGPQLDDLVKLKICEVLTQESELSKLRDRVVTLEAGVDKWKEIARNTAKQLRDLELVFKKLAADGKQENPTVVPIKITRSVGLQVGAGSLTPAQQQQIQQQQMQRKLMAQQQQQKKAGIITNRPANGGPPMGRPSNLRQVPPTMGLRPPLGQPLAAQPAPGVAAGGKPTVPAAARLAQNVSPSTSPGKPSSSPGGTSSTYPGVTRMVQAAPAAGGGGGRLTPNGVRPVTAAGRPMQVRLVPSTAKVTAGCIDLTEEDDKVTVTSSVSPAVMSVVNQSPAKQIMTSGIRIVPQNQLTNNPAAPVLATVAAPAGPRLTFVVPATATAGGQTRNLVFTSATTTQLSGNRSILTVARPRLAAPAQNVILGSNSVHTLPATGAHNPMVRTTASSPIRRITAVTPTNRIYRPPVILPMRHPAPLPPTEYIAANALWKKSPPQPELKISKCDSRQRGIILSWKMEEYGDMHEPIASYQLFAYQEPANATPSTSMWKRVGDVKAMALPMACTLTQFSEGNKYHFAVRAVDIRNRFGPFSTPGSLMLSRS